MLVKVLISLGLLFIVNLVEQASVLPSMKLTPRCRFIILAVVVAPLAEEIGRMISLYFDAALTYTLILAVAEFVTGILQIVLLGSSIWTLEDKALLIGLRCAVVGMHLMCYYLLTFYGIMPALIMHALWNGLISQAIVYYGVSCGRQMSFKVFADTLEMVDTLNS